MDIEGICVIVQTEMQHNMLSISDPDLPLGSQTDWIPV